MSSIQDLIKLKQDARNNPIEFWDSHAKSEIDWFNLYETVLDTKNAPFFKWFPEGKINITYKILACSDIFVLPSESESFGLVALEAMASKNAIVSTNIGGISELNIDKKTGFLSKVGDIEKMTNDIILLLQKPLLLEKFKTNAYERSSKFDLQEILPMYLNIYYELCKAQNIK